MPLENRKKSEYRFWMKFFKQAPNLTEEYKRRVVSSTDGYINWDFLIASLAFKHMSQHYRQALTYAQNRILKIVRANQFHANEVFDKQYLAELKKYAQEVVDKREKDIKRHDGYIRQIWEYINGIKTLKNHKEVHKQWLSILLAFEGKASEDSTFASLSLLRNKWIIIVIIGLFVWCFS